MSGEGLLPGHADTLHENVVIFIKREERGVMSHLEASLGKIFKMAHSHGCSCAGWESIAQVGLLTRSPPCLCFMWLAFLTAWQLGSERASQELVFLKTWA